jgi:hypothetical protein
MGLQASKVLKFHKMSGDIGASVETCALNCPLPVEIRFNQLRSCPERDITLSGIVVSAPPPETVWRETSYGSLNYAIT